MYIVCRYNTMGCLFVDRYWYTILLWLTLVGANRSWGCAEPYEMEPKFIKVPIEVMDGVIKVEQCKPRVQADPGLRVPSFKV